jgi:hypothetical protein
MKQNYDWRHSKQESRDFEVFVEPFLTVQNYISNRDYLKDFLGRKMSIIVITS